MQAQVVYSCIEECVTWSFISQLYESSVLRSTDLCSLQR